MTPIRTIPFQAIELIKKFEGLRLDAYQDSVGVWTIGYGHTAGVDAHTHISAADAERLLVKDLTSAASAIDKFVTVPLSYNEFSALLSFVFNLGIRSLQHSTLLTKLNAGDRKGTAEEFNRWNHAGGKVMAGLTTRRKAEHDLFLKS